LPSSQRDASDRGEDVLPLDGELSPRERDADREEAVPRRREAPVLGPFVTSTYALLSEASVCPSSRRTRALHDPPVGPGFRVDLPQRVAIHLVDDVGHAPRKLSRNTVAADGHRPADSDARHVGLADFSIDAHRVGVAEVEDAPRPDGLAGPDGDVDDHTVHPLPVDAEVGLGHPNLGLGLARGGVGRVEAPNDDERPRHLRTGPFRRTRSS